MTLSLRRIGISITLSTLLVGASASAEVVLRTVPVQDLKILDPIWTTSYITRNHAYMVYDTLFSVDEKGLVRPQMVDKYTTSPDAKIWSFTLRAGLKFSDGSPITSGDVIASLARWGKRDVVGQKMYSAMESIVPDGDKGFRMTFKQPFGVVLDALGKPSSNVPFIMPRNVAETPADKQIESFVGSGPFTLSKEDFRPGDRAIYRKNRHYLPRKEPASGLAGGKVVYVDRVDWVFLRDVQTQGNALLNGEVDMLEVVPAARYPEFRTSDKIELVEVAPPGEFTLHFNHKVPPFNNPKARRAAMLAINQEPMLRAQATYRDFYKPCAAIYVCGSLYSDLPTGFFTGKPNLEEARKLLKESGYDGKPILAQSPSDVPNLSRLPIVYAELLKQVGFNVEVQSMDWASMSTMRSKKEGPELNKWHFFMTFLAGADTGNPLFNIGLTGNGDQGFPGWPVDPELEALKAKFVETVDAAQRRDLAAKIQLRALESGVLAPIGAVKAPTAVRRGVISGLLKAPLVVYWNVKKQ
jgi:peptide/nickel transport system substrate-binding protein